MFEERVKCVHSKDRNREGGGESWIVSLDGRSVKLTCAMGGKSQCGVSVRDVRVRWGVNEKSEASVPVKLGFGKNLQQLT